MTVTEILSVVCFVLAGLGVLIKLIDRDWPQWWFRPDFTAQSQRMAEEARQRHIHATARSIVEPERRKLTALMTPAKLVDLDLYRRGR